MGGSGSPSALGGLSPRSADPTLLSRVGDRVGELGAAGPIFFWGNSMVSLAYGGGSRVGKGRGVIIVPALQQGRQFALSDGETFAQQGRSTYLSRVGDPGPAG